MLDALKEAEKAKKPPVSDLFNDVYDQMPKNLLEQKEELEALLNEYREFYPINDFATEEEAVMLRQRTQN